jgi:hypothetical protein
LPDKQDEQLHEGFWQEVKQLTGQADLDIWFADESGFGGHDQPVNF